MRSLRLFCAALLAAFVGLLMTTTDVAAKNTGITSGEFPDPATGCQDVTCHSGGITPVVIVEGPLEVVESSINEYTVTIFEVSVQDHGGLNVSASDGTLLTGGANAARTHVLLDQITHTNRKAAVDGEVRFSFLWQSPPSLGSVDLNVWGQAVDFNLLETGDGASRVPLTVDVIEGPPPVCGDGIWDASEECDDGNNDDGDGCSAECRLEQPQDKDQQRCINALNKSLAKVARAQRKAITRCIKNGSKGKLSGQDPIETCLAANDAKVERATQRTETIYDARCDRADPPGFGATGPDAVNQAAMEKELSLIRAIFGSDLDAAIVRTDDPGPADARAEASCQVAAAKQAGKCQHSKLMTFVACEKDGLRGGRSGDVYPGADDPFDTSDDLERCMDFELIPKAVNRASKACDAKLGKKLRYECEGLDIPSLFPGECSSAQDLTELKDCLARLTECYVCQELNQADGLKRDCDELDNGAVDGSCLTFPQ
jgi:cysteine-rich repeat protein